MQVERDTVLAGRYRIEQLLGSGGMGSVWRAEDLRLGRPVAVKVAVESRDTEGSVGQARRRLRREAEALAALSEPRIARIYDLVEADREVCLVMELVKGESLAARLRRTPRLTASEALEIAGQCAQALQAAHRIGIVHRDVKPSNIMLAPDGVKVVDFGIAAHINRSHTETTATMPHHVVGSAAYLAPERALGRLAVGASDFYSLGVVLYEMLAGRLPFEAEESLAMLHAHTSMPPARLPATVPAPAAALCMRLLSKRPEERPASPLVFAAVREALNGVSTQPVSRISDRVGQRGTAPLLAAISSAAVMIAAGITWVLLDQPATASATSPAPSSSVASAPAVVPSATLPHTVSHTSAPPAVPVSVKQPVSAEKPTTATVRQQQPSESHGHNPAPKSKAPTTPKAPPPKQPGGDKHSHGKDGGGRD